MPVGGPRYWVGTSGYNYNEWKGSFYPEKISSKKMLPYYADRLPTVEINYTFYRMPTSRLLSMRLSSCGRCQPILGCPMPPLVPTTR